ncbi:Glycosyl phosphatidyl inositol anchor synthesis [Friedmanniomyces endolithicus]|nr:Glycosyl phosphatidyl inositol anchor synthesis [Friedmanniomyces endolithicus]KAK0844328.1 Glycosyl phosphatidyl inositol anchor synthesis [Friedmanniomyces endolithicus]KAK0851532.1 Glycosyl phosphatidyl inositol anchor synthesis [Friedmanniomyces endolithicus]
MARLGRVGFLGVAVVFHVVYLLSIFDVYFRSPIVSGMRAYRVDTAPAPAKRLVLYVGDGLRADKAFQFFPDPSPSANASSAQEPQPLAPFLRSKVLHEGTFGVSHTRVPTESRPGHVALIAGLYEDVSSVTTGWKLNPVNFDSVFNRSRHTWQWGSPDILPMFSTGAVPGRVTDDTYGAEFEDYSKDATELDYWVFDKVKQLFKDAETDADLNVRLREDKVVFFLHLLGLDTTGHSYRPYSREYLHNIKIVDEGVKEITKLIDDFYNDGETAYVFTADHGMSDWGSHGDGHPDNTRTPLIAWGAGVAKPSTVASGMAPGHEDGFSHDWHLDHVQRHDVAQADVATLMAYLAGLEFPVNSVGELPLSYLTASEGEKASAMLVNAREILEMYHVKEEDKSATVLRYVPYGPFAGVNQTTNERLTHVETTIGSGQYQQAIQASDELIQLGLQGLRYLQTYDWLFLRTLVTAGYLGWIAFAFTTAVDAYVLDGKYDAERTVTSITAFASVLVALYGFLFAQMSPLTYYLYSFFPVMFWEEVFVRRKALLAGRNKLFAKSSRQDMLKLALNFAGYIAILEVMVQSYYHRSIYTVCYFLATAWPAFYGTDFLRENALLCSTWALGCISMGVFTLLPAIKVESATMILVGGSLILAVGVLYIALEKTLLASTALPGMDRNGLGAMKADGISRGILGAQVGLIALAMLVTRSSVASLQAKQGLPLGTQMVGWLTLAAQDALASTGPPQPTSSPSPSPQPTQVTLVDIAAPQLSTLPPASASALQDHADSPVALTTSATPAPTASMAQPSSTTAQSSAQPAPLKSALKVSSVATQPSVPLPVSDAGDQASVVILSDTITSDPAPTQTYRRRRSKVQRLNTQDSKMSLLSRVSTSQSYADTKPIRNEVQGYPVLIQIFILFFLMLWALPLVLLAGMFYVLFTLPRRWFRRRSRMERGRLPPKDADYRRASVAEAAMVKPGEARGLRELPPAETAVSLRTKPSWRFLSKMSAVDPDTASTPAIEYPNERLPRTTPARPSASSLSIRPANDGKIVSRPMWSPRSSSRESVAGTVAGSGWRTATPPPPQSRLRGAANEVVPASAMDRSKLRRSWSTETINGDRAPGPKELEDLHNRFHTTQKPTSIRSRASSRSSSGSRHIVVARDFANKLATPPVPPSATYAANRAMATFSAPAKPRRSSITSTDVVHDIVAHLRCRRPRRIHHADMLPVASLVVPFLHALQPRDHYLHRLVVIFLALGPMFIILTISYEGLFYLAIAITLVSWVRLEHRIHQRFSPASSPPSTHSPLDLTTPLAPALSAARDREQALETGDYRSLTLSDARICLFFLFFLQSAFFSTGNIASISSFSLDAVYRLLPIFDPFSQGALLLLKILAPFALVSANLGILTRRLKLRGGSLFAVVMGIGDYLTLRFFWEVKDEGSWLDIGESITCFVIASMLCVFVAALEALSEVFIRGVEFADDGAGRRKEVVSGNGAMNGGLKSGSGGDNAMATSR